MIIPDPKVFQAARAFAQGEPLENIKEILLNCIDFDSVDADEIVFRADAHRKDIDGGYNAFICIVNLVLKTDVYYMQRISRRNWEKRSRVPQQMPANEEIVFHNSYKFF